MATSPWSTTDLFKQYAIILARKMGFVAAGWLVVYFLSQPMRWVPKEGVNILTLFGLVVGGFAGMVAGWYLATDSVEESSMRGLTLWIILVLASVIPMWVVEGVMHALTHWEMNFGGFMIVVSAMLMALASAVWHASSQE